MLPLLKLFNKTENTGTFFGAVFDAAKLNLILFKDGYPLCHAQEHLNHGVVVDGRIIDQDQFNQQLNLCKERCLAVQADERVHTIYFGSGGGNIVTALTSARQRRSPEDKISKGVLTGMYKELEQSALNTALTEAYQTTGNDQLDLERVLNDTTYLKLDGELTYNPVGESGELLEAEVLAAYCTPSYVDSLESAAKGVRLTLGGVFPLQYLLARKLTAKLGDHYDATLLTIYTGFTDISVVFGGQLVKTLTLPLGNRELERDLDFWMDGAELAFTNFSGVKTFAHNVFVCGEGLERTDFWETLEWREWEEKVPFKTRPVFTKLDASYVDLPQDYKG
ncbi:hypothetical protein KKG63_00480, partial [Patescibacteria group bacterium]|nr:hypothetical protein [Patescibacteria group bacterium]